MKIFFGILMMTIPVIPIVQMNAGHIPTNVNDNPIKRPTNRKIKNSVSSTVRKKTKKAKMNDPKMKKNPQKYKPAFSRSQNLSHKSKNGFKMKSAVFLIIFHHILSIGLNSESDPINVGNTFYYSEKRMDIIS